MRPPESSRFSVCELLKRSYFEARTQLPRPLPPPFSLIRFLPANSIGIPLEDLNRDLRKRWTFGGVLSLNITLLALYILPRENS